MTYTPKLELQKICKSFPGVRALDGVNLVLNKGTVHALVGENGAGKSTLMKILDGVHQPDEGRILLDGITATRHHVINGLPARDATVTDLHQRAIPLDTVIDRLEKAELTRDIRYMPSVKSGDNVVPADRFKKEENCFAFYSPSSDGSLRLIADFPTSGEAYDFMDTIKAFFKEFPSELLDVTCTSGEELTKLSHQIQETEKTMSAQSQTSISQKTKPHFNTRIANQLSRQLRDGTAPMQRQGVQDIIANEYDTAAKISESIGLPVMATVGNDNLVDAAKEFVHRRITSTTRHGTSPIDLTHFTAALGGGAVGCTNVGWGCACRRGCCITR